MFNKLKSVIDNLSVVTISKNNDRDFANNIKENLKPIKRVIQILGGVSAAATIVSIASKPGTLNLLLISNTNLYLSHVPIVFFIAILGYSYFMMYRNYFAKVHPDIGSKPRKFATPTFVFLSLALFFQVFSFGYFSYLITAILLLIGLFFSIIFSYTVREIDSQAMILIKENSTTEEYNEIIESLNSIDKERQDVRNIKNKIYVYDLLYVFRGWLYYNWFCFLSIFLYTVYIYLFPKSVGILDVTHNIVIRSEEHTYLHLLFFLIILLSGLLGSTRAYRNTIGWSIESFNKSLSIINTQIEKISLKK